MQIEKASESFKRKLLRLFTTNQTLSVDGTHYRFAFRGETWDMAGETFEALESGLFMLGKKLLGNEAEPHWLYVGPVDHAIDGIEHQLMQRHEGDLKAVHDAISVTAMNAALQKLQQDNASRRHACNQRTDITVSGAEEDIAISL